MNNYFTYANDNSSMYNLAVFTIGGANNHSSNDEETSETISMSHSNSWDLHGVTYTSPLKFNMTVCKADGSYMSIIEENSAKKWLCRLTRNWLYIDKDGFYDIRFNCRFTNPIEERVDDNIIGITFTVICDSPYGYSYPYEYNYTSTTSLSFNINISNTFSDMFVFPEIKITNATGTISIKNNTTNEEAVISDCVSNETIVLNCNNDVIKTTVPRDIISAWNKNGLSFMDGINNITLSGSFNIKFTYMIPMRIGG